jgi:hypothetical protein
VEISEVGWCGQKVLESRLRVSGCGHPQLRIFHDLTPKSVKKMQEEGNIYTDT